MIVYCVISFYTRNKKKRYKYIYSLFIIVSIIIYSQHDLNNEILYLIYFIINRYTITKLEIKKKTVLFSLHA